MSTIVLDESLRSRLQDLREPIAVCEPDGRTVGHFLPEDLFIKWLYAQAQTAVSSETLDEAARNPNGRKLSEILAGLRST